MGDAQYNNIMVDLETLGTFADSAIISIGAVKFNLDSGVISDDEFYASISVESNVVQGRGIQEDTLIWWMRQSEEARKVFFEPKVILPLALENFADWVDHPDYQVWSNGADFDIPMLAHAFHFNGMAAPWKFFNTRCHRTMKNLPIAQRAQKPANPLAHNALADARAQAEHLINIHKAMKGAA